MNAGSAGRRGDEGFMGGIDGLVFGVLVFVLGTLAVVNVWTVVDAKVAAAAAAREAARAYVEAEGGTEAVEAAWRAASAAVQAHGRRGERVRVVVAEGSFSRCERVVLEVRYPVSVGAVPVVAARGATVTVSARHSEVVDPYRSGLPGQAACEHA